MSIFIEYCTVKEVSQLTGLSEVAIHKRCAAGYISGLIKRNNKRLIPLEEVEKLKSPGHCSEHKRKEALNKLAKIRLFDRKRKEYRSRYGLAMPGRHHLIPIEDIEKRALESCGVPRSTLFRWKRRYNEFGLDGLIDTRGGKYKKRQQG